MYENDDFFKMLNSYTATENQTEQQQFDDSPQTNRGFEQERSPYVDDYSTKQNFEEETSYNSFERNEELQQTEQSNVRQMDKPTILRQEKAVNLIKKRERIYISPRLKIAAVFCAIIFAALIFATIWNFASASVLQASFAGKEAQINEINQSINELRVEYNELSKLGDEALSGYVSKVENVNSFTLSMEDYYIEPEIEKLPSNWFNDVCEFFSKLFA